MGIPIFLLSFLEGDLSLFVSNTLLLILFATLALAASFLIMVPSGRLGKSEYQRPGVQEIKGFYGIGRGWFAGRLIYPDSADDFLCADT
jgi:hypothetical protein